jgi:hypothetical protein
MLGSTAALLLRPSWRATAFEPTPLNPRPLSPFLRLPSLALAISTQSARTLARDQLTGTTRLNRLKIRRIELPVGSFATNGKRPPCPDGLSKQIATYPTGDTEFGH